jgi:hypothetical protein
LSPRRFGNSSLVALALPMPEEESHSYHQFS